MFLKAEHQPISLHPYVEKFVRENKIKFQRYRKLEVKFEPIKEAENYFDETKKTLQFKGEPLGQRTSTSMVAGTHVASSQTLSNQTSTNKSSSCVTRSVARKRKSSFSISKDNNLSPLEEEKIASARKNIVTKETFSLEVYMTQRGFKKFDHTKMDLYRFIDAFETGCKVMKYNDREKLTSFLFFLDQVEENTYLTIRTHQAPSEWEEFKQIFIDYYHNTIYGRGYKYLCCKYTQGSILKYVQKKIEVLRFYLKSCPDVDIIQLVSWTLPDECQKNIMPKLCSTTKAFFDAIREYEEENEDEEEATATTDQATNNGGTENVQSIENTN